MTLVELANAIEEENTDKAKVLVKELFKEGVSPAYIVMKGLTKGICSLGEKWSKGEAFLTDVLIAVTTFREVMELV